MPSPTKAQLDYSRLPPPWYRRTRVRRLLLIAVLAILLFLGWRCGPSIWAKAQFSYWQARCMSYRAPADQIVYEDAINAPALVWEDSRPVGGSPSVESTFPQVMARAVRCWDKFCLLRGHGPGPQQGILFLHGRKDPTGQRWLVEVQIDSRSWNALNLTCIAESREGYDTTLGGSWFVGAKFIGGEQPVEKLRIYAGQPDPSDPSRFSIPVELGDRKGKLDGRVNRDGAIDLDLNLNSPEGE